MMSNSVDFTRPQRLNGAGVVVEGVLGFVRLLRSLAVPIIYLFVKHSDVFLKGKFWLGALLVFVVYFVWTYWRHRNFRYFIDAERAEFVVDTGIFTKNRVVLKLENIVQINVKQNFVQQALDLYSVELDSAGADKKEIDLYALNEPTALALKAYLSGQSLHQEAEEPSRRVEAPAEVLFSISNRHIVLVSLLTNYKQGFGLFFVFLIGLLNNFRDFFPDWHFRDAQDWTVTHWSEFVGVVALVIGAVLLVPIFINLWKYLLRYYNFSLQRNARGNIVMRFGLFNVHDIILSKRKIQYFTFTQNRLLKPLKLGILSLHQIASNETGRDGATVLMPGIATSSRDRVWDIVFGKDIYGELKELKPKVGLLIRRCVLLFLGTAITFVFAYLLESNTFVYAGIGFLATLLLVYNGLFFANYRFLVSDTVLIKRTGVWDLREEVMPIDKLVHVAFSQTVWQRRSGTANLEVSTSSGSIEFAFFDAIAMEQISNELLYRMEAGAEQWG